MRNFDFSLTKKALFVFALATFCVVGCSKKKSKLSQAGSGNYGFKNDFSSNYSSGSETPGSSQDFSVNVGDRIFFDTDSSLIRSDAQETLSKQVYWLTRYKSYKIVIQGHADERGTREYNLALGARRAAAVRDFLVSKGLEINRVTTISYGKEKPVAVCDDISCWSQNRRAVTLLQTGAY